MAEAQRIAEYNERRYSMAIRAIPLWEGRTLFRSHLGRIRTWAHTHNVTDANQLKIGLFSSIHGDPLELVQEFDIDSPNFEALVTYKDYAQALKDIFHPRAEAGLARTEFRIRRQGPQEDVGTYFASKRQLWIEAFGAEADFTTFLPELINGLHSTVVKRRIKHASPEDAEDAKKKLFEIVANERDAFLDGYAESTNLEGLATVSSGARKKILNPNPDAMDISALHDGKHNKNHKKVSGKCHNCGHLGHYIRDCRKPRKDGSGSGKAAGNSKPRGHFKPSTNQGAVPKKVCNFCRKTGHLEAQCFQKRKSKNGAGSGVRELAEELSEQDIENLQLQEAVSQLQESIQAIHGWSDDPWDREDAESPAWDSPIVEEQWGEDTESEPDSYWDLGRYSPIDPDDYTRVTSEDDEPVQDVDEPVQDVREEGGLCAEQEEYIEYMTLEDAEHDINLCIRPFPSRRASDHDDYELEERPFYQVCDNWSNGSQVEIW